MNVPGREETQQRLVERFPALGGLSPARLDGLLAEAQLLRVPAGGVIFDADQPCRGFPLVLEGAVRVVMSAPRTSPRAVSSRGGMRDGNANCANPGRPG